MGAHIGHRDFRRSFMEKLNTIKRGQVLVNAGEYGPVWRITEGLFRLERAGHDGLSLVQLGLPGDLLGVEALCAEPYAYTITAITTGQAELVDATHELSRFGIVAKAYLQQQRRTHDMMKLRGGPVSERLAHFLKLLARNVDGSERELDRRDLPILKEIASILDTATETVCRELNAFLPARVYQRPAKREVWAGEELAMAA
jgi:CRP-like cAMP-binding protein